MEFSFLLYLMKVKKAAPSAACNDVEMYCEACMKKIWLGSSLGSFDVYLYQLSTKGLGPRYLQGNTDMRFKVLSLNYVKYFFL